jgi:phage repressor protein C with HTH and peptisase S24 domain
MLGMITYSDIIRVGRKRLKMSQQAFADAVGVTRSAVQQWERGETGPTRKNQPAVARVLGITAAELMNPTQDVLDRAGRQTERTGRQRATAHEVPLDGNPEYHTIRRASVKASAGITGFAIDYDNGGNDPGNPIVFRRDWYEQRGYRPERMIAMRVHGSSMEPTLYDGDVVVVNMDSTSPKDGVAYLLLYEGDPVVKRLVRDAGAWWLASDNPDQRRYPRKLCDEATKVIGQVVYKQSEHI